MIVNIIIFVFYYFLYILKLVSHTKLQLPIRLLKSYIKGLCFKLFYITILDVMNLSVYILYIQTNRVFI